MAGPSQAASSDKGDLLALDDWSTSSPGISYRCLVQQTLEFVCLNDSAFIKEFACLDVVRPRDQFVGSIAAVEEQRARRGMLEAEIGSRQGRLNEAEVEEDLAQVTEGNVVIVQGHV